MLGAVADDGQVGGPALAVLVRRNLHVRRADFLVALKEELEVGLGLQAGSLEGVEGGQDHDDRRTIVGSRTGVDPPVRIDAALRQGHDRRTVRQPTVPYHRVPGVVAHPQGDVHRLAVVVAVEEQGATGPGDATPAEDVGGAAGLQ